MDNRRETGVALGETKDQICPRVGGSSCSCGLGMHEYPALHTPGHVLVVHTYIASCSISVFKK